MFILTKVWQLIRIKKEEREKYQLFYKLLKRFFYTYLVIAGIIIGVSIYFNIDAIKDGDFQNWTSFVLELGLGAYMATAILTYENVQKKRNEKQQQDIADLVIGIKKIEESQQKIIQEQEEFIAKKRNQAHTGLNGNIFSLRFSVHGLERDFNRLYEGKLTQEEYLEQIKKNLPHIKNSINNVKNYCDANEPYLDEDILSSIHRLLVEGNVYCEMVDDSRELFDPTSDYPKLINQIWAEIPDPYNGYDKLKKLYSDKS